MCGLFGVAQTLDLSVAQIYKADNARDKLAHRGPDNSSSWVSDKVYIGHRRLSVMDISESANQPMHSQSAVITANGEIYNYKALREELEIHGYKFNSHSDSEVILHGYEHWGATVLSHKMDGMYAAVILDLTKNQLVFIRDRVGIKPLYYYFDTDTIVWASELKAISEYMGADKLEIDNTSIVDFLLYRYIPAPKTIFQKVYKLEPAQILKIDLDSFSISKKRYWSIEGTEISDSHENIKAQFLKLFQESVSEQLISDVPLGLFLSGGIDSSAVAAFATKQRELNSFSIGFDDPIKDESYYSKLVATFINSKHHSHQVSDSEVSKLAKKLPDWFDEPFGDTSAIPTWLVSHLARREVTVALSGDGGDELFGGYKWYEKFDRLRSLQRWFPFKTRYGVKLPRFVPKRRTLELLSIRDPLVLYSRIRKGLPMQALRKWMAELKVPSSYDPYWAYRAWYKPSLGNKKAAQLIDFNTYLPDDILVKVDRVSMDLSLECRPPFLSKKLVEFAFSLPESFIYLNDELKGGLKYALRDVLPEIILNRPKQGFSLPNNGWKDNLTRLSESTIQEKLLVKFIHFMKRPL